jgi:alpha/beta superfamily hydrolase
MAKPLPPPPANPELSPPVHIIDEQPLTIPGLPGEPAIEARVRASPDASRAVLLCHPQPLYGGTMHSAVIVAVTKMLAANGGDHVATLRFNFRGVGASEGHYDEGRGEVLDARAAIRALHLRAPNAAMTVCGYSFGTWVGLRAAVLEEGVERVALIAPAVHLFQFAPEDGAAFSGRVAIFVGDEDEFCSKDDAEALARELGATLTVLEGNGHAFLRSRRKLAEAVTPFVAPEIMAT